MDQRKVWPQRMVTIAVVNFALFVVISLMLGGTALNGRVDDGQFFLGEHGRFLEVNRWVYLYSWLHGVSVLSTHFLAFVASIEMLVKKRW